MSAHDDECTCTTCVPCRCGAESCDDDSAICACGYAHVMPPRWGGFGEMAGYTTFTRCASCERDNRASAREDAADAAGGWS